MDELSVRERAKALRDAERSERKEERRKQRDWRRAGRQYKRQLFYEEHRKGIIRLAVLASVLAVVSGVLYYVYTSHEVTKITVTGNTLHSDDEIIRTVTAGRFGNNTIYLKHRYEGKEITDIPFVEKLVVEIPERDEIRITVYEKALAGYVNYLGYYMYFARDGTVVEASDDKVAGIPEVTGLSFSHIVMHEKLPVENTGIFERILDVTQRLNKYSLTVDKLYFDHSGNLTLYYGDVRAYLGADNYTDEKISNLSHILPELEGRSGTIDLSGYTPDQQIISFTDKKPIE